jgi:hypothetical protein
MVAPAGAQSGPSGTPTPGAIDPDRNKHEFNRGESIYSAPDPEKLLRYRVINSNPAAMQELADLVVKFKALQDLRAEGGYDEGKARELALLKVTLYNKYNLGGTMLKVPKAKMPQYLAFWRGFWERVDQFKKNNQDIAGPGPYTLPSSGPLAALRESGKSFLASVAGEFAIRQAAAIHRQGEGYPACNEIFYGSPIPLMKVDPYDDDLFYFQSINKNNYITDYRRTLREEDVVEGTFTTRHDWYMDDYKPVVNSKNGKMSLQGEIFLASITETTWCGRAAGDNINRQTRIMSYFPPRFRDLKGQGQVRSDIYCAPSNSDAFKRYQPLYSNRTEITEEPDWVCK